MPGHVNLAALQAITDLAIGEGGIATMRPTFISGEVDLVETDHQQEPVVEYTDGYGLLVVKEIGSAYSSGKILCATDQFLLTGMNESDQERFSMAYTIADPVLRGGRGRRPRMYAYTGILVDTEKDGSGIAVWRWVYENYLRASSCVNLNAVIEFTFRDQYRKGFITTCNLSYDANNPQRAALMWTMFVIGVNRANS
jgi:hypothetical protein